MTTKIQWCDETINVFTGCMPVSEACEHCYAKRYANSRLKGKYGYPEDDPFKPTYHSDRMLSLRKKLKSWKKPRKIFHVSMGDIFHDEFRKGVVPWEKVYTLFWNIQGFDHIHIFLTKRPKNMYDFFDFWFHPSELPLKNIWIGVTAENQNRADERIPILLQIPAAVRFVSVEPMLEMINLRSYLYLLGDNTFYGDTKPKIDWVIAGPETGPGKRPCPEGAIENLYEQCKVAGIPFFDKRKDYIAREFPE